MKKFIITAAAVLTLSLPTVSTAKADGNVKYNLKVKGMFCQSCAAKSKNALKRIKGVKSVSVNVDKGNVAVCAAPSTKLTDVALKELFLSKGFTYKGKSKAGSC